MKTWVSVTGDTVGTPSHEAHLAEAAAGSTAALHDLIIHMIPTMRRRIRHLAMRVRHGGGGCPYEGEDILQHAVLLLLQRGSRILRQWDQTRGLSIEGFFGLYAERVACSWLRSGRLSGWAEKASPPEEFERHSHLTIEAVLEDRDTLSKVLGQICEHLDDSKRELFRALILEPLPVPCVSRKFNLSPNAVYCARRRLRLLTKSICQTLLQEKPAPETKCLLSASQQGVCARPSHSTSLT